MISREDIKAIHETPINTKAVIDLLNLKKKLNENDFGMMLGLAYNYGVMQGKRSERNRLKK